MENEPDYKCEKCSKELTFDSVGYLGARDPKDQSCGPFTDLLCLCADCAAAKGLLPEGE